MKVTETDGKLCIDTPYHPDFVSRIKKAGGKWDGKSWVIDAQLADVARTIMRDVYGTDDTAEAERCTVDVAVHKELYTLHGPVTLLGKVLSSARGRDSGAKAGDGVAYIESGPKSGGSMKNWTSDVPAGSVIRLLNVPVALLDNDLPEGVTVQVVEQPKHAETADSLQAERVRLLERVAEIDRQLVAIVS